MEQLMENKFEFFFKLQKKNNQNNPQYVYSNISTSYVEDLWELTLKGEYYPFLNKEQTLKEIDEKIFNNLQNADFFVNDNKDKKPFASFFYILVILLEIRRWMIFFNQYQRGGWRENASNESGILCIDELITKLRRTVSNGNEFSKELTEAVRNFYWTYIPQFQKFLNDIWTVHHTYVLEGFDYSALQDKKTIFEQKNKKDINYFTLENISKIFLNFFARLNNWNPVFNDIPKRDVVLEYINEQKDGNDNYLGLDAFIDDLYALEHNIEQILFIYLNTFRPLKHFLFTVSQSINNWNLVIEDALNKKDDASFVSLASYYKSILNIINSTTNSKESLISDLNNANTNISNQAISSQFLDANTLIDPKNTNALMKLLELEKSSVQNSANSQIPGLVVEDNSKFNKIRFYVEMDYYNETRTQKTKQTYFDKLSSYNYTDYFETSFKELFSKQEDNEQEIVIQTSNEEETSKANIYKNWLNNIKTNLALNDAGFLLSSNYYIDNTLLPTVSDLNINKNASDLLVLHNRWTKALNAWIINILIEDDVLEIALNNEAILEEANQVSSENDYELAKQGSKSFKR